MSHALLNFLRQFAILSLVLASSMVIPAHAEKADQNKPIILEAEKVSVNDVQQVYELSGEVLLTKGSILITGEKGNIKVDPETYQVTIDGQLLTCEPADVLPMAQRYFMF